MTRKQRRLDRIRAIEREYRVASIAAEDSMIAFVDPAALDRERLKT